DMATLNYTWYKYTDVTLQDGTTKTVNNGTISYSFSMQWAEFSTNPNWDHWVTFSGPNVTGGVLGNVWLDYINDFNKPAGTFDFSFTIIRTELTYGGYDGNGNATSIHQHQDGIMYSPNQGDASWQHLVNYWFVPGDGYPLYIKEDGGCWTNQAWGTNRDPSIVPDKEPPADAQYSVDSRVDNTRFSGQDGYLNASDFFKALWGEGNTDSLEYVGQFTDKIAREYQVEAEGIYWLLMRWGNPDSADIRSHYDVRIWLDADTLGLDYDEEGYWQVEGMMQTDDGEWVLRLRCANGMRGSLIFLTMDELVEAYGGKVKVFYNRPQIYWEDFNNFEGWDG
ncbi:MAG: hypothetical protein JW734_00285, partial [Candidatus Omnitrophica bacterium]|nr:hypothetical protein [Candidatus Omnitrophota bacterium]